MKVAILGDTHFGVRGNSPVFHKHFHKFYSEVFFPEIDNRGIDTIIQVGDLLDKRTAIDFLTYQTLKTSFLYPALERDMDIHILVGNHDAYFKQSNTLNGIESLFFDWKDSDKIHTYNYPRELLLGETNLCLLPWINDENMEQAMKVIADSKAFIAIGHLEIFGFEMYQGMPNSHGLDPAVFQKFEMTLSGHFHHKSSRNGIHYLGTPYEMTWMDWNDPKGFHILDLEKRELEFIHNPNQIFHKLIYSSDFDLDSLKDYQDCYVQVYIKDKNDLKKYEELTRRLSEAKAADVSYVEETVEVADTITENLESKTTLQVLHESIDTIETNKDKERLKALLGDIYRQAVDTSNEVLL